MSNRRVFLGQSSAIAGGLALSQVSKSFAAGAQKKIVMGGIGCGGQGTNLIRSFARIPNAELAYVCDPDQAHANSAAKEVEKITGKAPKVVSDLREVLDDKAVDAVTVATPDHWHAPATLLACQAGKHVYVEKPCSHNFREGQLMVQASRKYNKVIQLGTQNRSSSIIQEMIKKLEEGVIGEVLMARAYNIQKRSNIGKAQPSEPPSGFDYDLWIGPAPFVPFQKNRHHYTWHWWHNFGTGDMGNDGIHELDIARWGLGVETHPSMVAAIGSKCYFDDDQQFPDTQNVLFEYAGAAKSGMPKQLFFEMRIWSPYQPDGVENGCTFYGTEGWMALSKQNQPKIYDKKGKEVPIQRSGKPTKINHHEDFLEAIQSNRKPNADIQIGFTSSALCHLGNIAARVGRTLKFDPQAEIILGDNEAAQLLGRSYRDNHWAIPRA